MGLERDGLSSHSKTTVIANSHYELKFATARMSLAEHMELFARERLKQIKSEIEGVPRTLGGQRGSSGNVILHPELQIARVLAKQVVAQRL